MSIKTENLSYIYSKGTAFEKTALRNVSLSIEDGEFVGLIGRTGSGKSTLMQLLNGLLSPADGKVFINGEDIYAKNAKPAKTANKKSAKNLHAKVGLVFQYPEHQLFEMTVFKDVAFGPKNLGLSEAEVKARVIDALEIVKIPEGYYEKSPFELSGGEKRRVAIAGVLSMNPEILILDEPTAGLDPVGKAEILSEIENLKGKKTIIFSSHIMDDVARLSDKIIVLEDGELAFCGTPDEVFSRGEWLEGIGLSLTQPSELLLALKRRGLDVDIGKHSPNAAAHEILRALRCKGGGQA